MLCYAIKELLKCLETVVNSELKNVYDRLNANRLTINKLTPRKQNVVIFRPRQKRLLIIRHVSEF